MNIEEKIAEIIASNDVATASKTIAEIMKNLGHGESSVVIGYDSVEEYVDREIDRVCEQHFG